MLSNKMTFSLTSLVVLLAFGLICFVPSAMATGDAKKSHIDIDVKITTGESMIDVDATDHADIDDIQIATGRDRASRDFTATAGLIITLLVEFSEQVELQGPEIVETDATDPDVEVRNSGHFFGADDIYVRAFDAEGRALGQLSLDTVATTEDSILAFRDATNPGRQYLVRVDEENLVSAYRTELRTPTGAGFEIASLFFFIPRGVSAVTDKVLALEGVDDVKNAAVTSGIRRADFAHAVAHFAPGAHQHLNKASNVFRVDLVDDDQGDPQYAMLTSASTADDVAESGLAPSEDESDGTGTPGVVSIMRIVDRAGFVESGAFDVRIILTEEPKGGLTAAGIMVENGSVTSLTKGLTYKGGHNEIEIAARTIDREDPLEDVDIAAVTIEKMDSQLGPAMVDFYHVEDDDTEAAEAENPVDDAETGENGTVPNFPEATGRDNMYHSYIARIQPNAGVDGMVTVSIMQFEDNVLPVGKQYIPLTREQRLATTLTGTAMHVRDARVKNESLSVRVSSAGDTKIVAATTAYELRLKDNVGIFNLNPNLKAIDKGLVIPANGYLVLASGKTDSDPISGVASVDAKIAQKFTAAQQRYNVVYDFKLPFPADDLSNFFRNGGSLSLVHADIAAATGSGHDDSKASQDGVTTHADYTGYVGATSTAIAAGSVIISEIMWGLDGTSMNSQYIELQNTTAAAIGIDHLEWAIAVGSAPAPFAAIDTVGNNPAPVAPATSGYWQVPGQNGGESVGTVGTTITDIVSMSRVTGGTDGTAEASWAASMIPSANLVGRRIGTPGAANVYVMPASAPAPTPEPVTPAAPAATAADIMITEVMVASDGGRLPQWIELANVSAAAVSLTGWSLGIDNDSADIDVVGASIEISLGNVEIGADQVALVVSKEGRNSGVGTGEGDLRADRIIDVQSMVSPASKRYSLLSEMGFMISLMPPQTGAVKTYGDVVGNLGKGWEIPMSESGRSSLIRREMGKTAEIMGTDAAGWILASETGLGGAYLTTFYGDADDMGTPGYNAGGALPVELSKFGAKRDPLTGQVMITWETQSELNNAGFYIKRSQQQDSKFVVVNPTMIAGAGTTSEKQSYTYADTTAQPNIVYYYQIEDVSLDGNRQTLTRAHRLKGHIGAIGKLTTLWGELKEQE